MAGISTTHFVDPVNGSDSNDGSSELEAWQTITKAVQSAQSASLVLLRGGVYPSLDGVTSATGRTQAATFMPYPGEFADMTNLVLGRASTSNNDGNAHCTYVRFVGLDWGTARVTFGWGCRNMEILGCNVARVQIQDGVRKVWIEDNNMVTSRVEGSTGVFFAGDDIEPEIRQVRIRRNFINAFTVGINARGCNDVVIEDNEMTGVEYLNELEPDAIHTDVIRTFGGAKNLIIRRNYLHDNEGQGIFFKDGITEDVTIENNVVTRMVGAFLALNVYDTRGLWMAHNVIDGGAQFGVASFNNTGIKMFNNIFGDWLISGPGATPQFDYRNYNWIADNTVSGSFANEANGIRNVAPVFEDEAAGDFRLVAGQPGLNVGTAGPVLGRAIPAFDRLGLPRPVGGATPDMGSDERQS